MAFKFVKRMSKPVLFMLSVMTMVFAADDESQFQMDEDCFVLELKEVPSPDQSLSKNKGKVLYPLSVSAPAGINRKEKSATAPNPTFKPRYQYSSDLEDNPGEGDNADNNDSLKIQDQPFAVSQSKPIEILSRKNSLLTKEEVGGGSSSFIVGSYPGKKRYRPQYGY